MGRAEIEREGERKEDMRVIGWALMKIDSSYPCPDKQESPITAAGASAINNGWVASALLA